MRATSLIATIVFALFAFADEPQTSSTAPPPRVGPAVFCEGQYALCIKAACSPIVTRNSDGTYSITQANCLCDVLDGWSMGPGTCRSRKPETVSGRTYLISTYSNYFNTKNANLTCDNTTWAWCYGSPCVIDEKDPSKATCTCPVQTSKAILLGNCKTSMCNGIWSAATVAENKFANEHFYQYGTDHNFQPPPNPPAPKCTDSTNE